MRATYDVTSVIKIILAIFLPLEKIQQQKPGGVESQKETTNSTGLLAEHKAEGQNTSGG